MKKISLLLVMAVALAASAIAQNAHANFGQRSSITVNLNDASICTTSLGGGIFPALSWSFGAVQPISTSVGGGGGTSGKAQVSDLTISKRTDACSPALFNLVVTGKHIAKVTLTQEDTKKDDTFKVTLEEVLVSSYQIGGTQSDEVPTEQVAFHFAKTCLEDIQTSTKTCYNAVTNTTF
jgi:type VI protein secretion system component Hcp